MNSKMLSSSKILKWVVHLIVFWAVQEQVLAVKRSYIVYLGTHPYGPEATPDDLERATNSHHDLLSTVLGSEVNTRDAIFYSYKHDINGFAAILEEGDAAKIARHPDVVSVFLNGNVQLYTTRSWQFLGLENEEGVSTPNSLWEKAKFGKDVIIAHLDGGVWPESPSFSDEGFDPIPSRWKGSCHNSNITCNRKLIGARYFNKGLISDGNTVKSWENSGRDFDGHGTHTLSTSGGNFVPGANMFGLANGTAKGGSPKARVASYKVCWKAGCSKADILQALDVAIHDGPDVISLSLGSREAFPYFEDAIAIGTFHAIRKNIAVVCAGGNGGPFPGTISNFAPWIFTVAASTMDREFHSSLVLMGDESNDVKGLSLSQPLPEKKYYPLITGAEAKAADSSADNATLCLAGTLDRQKVDGKILVCLVGIDDNTYTRFEKGGTALQAGAAGMILYNQNSNTEAQPESHVLPALYIEHKGGLKLLAYMNSTTDPMGYISHPLTLVDAKPAPKLAFFSSRGPNPITPEILKPDITAPGVQVLAAYSRAAPVAGGYYPDDKRRIPYILMSGTSMSCPHISGIVGLLRTLYPDWSPAAIKSAIMTTAQTRDDKQNPILESSTPYGYGAGHVQPNRAMDPGLVYDLTEKDHLNFLCAIGYNQTLINRITNGTTHDCPKNMSLAGYNYPSMVAPGLPATLSRTLKNVGTPGTYTARLTPPRPGVSVKVEPSTLKFQKIGEEKSFRLTLTRAANQTHSPPEVSMFGELTWTDGRHELRSQILVIMDDASGTQKKKSPH